MPTFLETWHALDELVPKPQTPDEVLFVNERRLRHVIGVRVHDELFARKRGEPWNRFRAGLPFAWDYLAGLRRFKKALRRLMDGLANET